MDGGDPARRKGTPGHAYPLSTCLPDHRRHLRQYAELSAAARSLLPWRELRYGPDTAEVLHFFPAPRLGAPLHVFVPGGYGQVLSEWESSFAAPGLVRRGCAFAALGYGLAPRHRLGDRVGMVRRALLWLHLHAAELGFDSTRVFLSGSATGAHLAAMCLLDGWLPVPLRARDLVRGATLSSGIYDLEPLLQTPVGTAIGLGGEDVARNSPLRHLHGDLPPIVVARGGEEPAGVAEQHEYLVAALRALETPVLDLVVPGRHHLDLPLGLADPDDPLGSVLLAQMRLTGTAQHQL